MLGAHGMRSFPRSGRAPWLPVQSKLFTKAGFAYFCCPAQYKGLHQVTWPAAQFLIYKNASSGYIDAVTYLKLKVLHS